MLLASIGALTSFDLLFVVVARFAAERHGGMAAGVCTGALLAGTVLIEPLVPRAMRRFGDRMVLAAGLVLLGVPSLALPAAADLPALIAICVLRGAGLGMVVVAGTAMTAGAVPARRRSEAMGLYGVAVGIPAVVCLPLGLWLVDRVGYPVVFLAAAAAALIALPAVLILPGAVAEARAVPAGPLLGDLRRDGLVRPLVVMGGVTLGAGVLLTFLPLALPVEHQHLAVAALLAQSATTPVARWVAGRFIDRIGPGRMLGPAVGLAAAGTAGMVWVAEPVVAIGGMAVFGLGFGLAQSATLAVMLERVPASRFGRVSALWNLAYDGGLGLGALGFGLLLGPLGYGAAFGLSGLLLLGALLPGRARIVTN